MNKIISHSSPGFDDKCLESAIHSLKAGDFSGRQTKVEAEKYLAEFMEINYAKLTNSGFAALQSALIAAGVDKGEKVIIPTLTCPSVYQAVCSLGAEPIVVDVGRDVPLISLEQATNKWPSRTERSVVIIPHMFGLTQDVQIFHDHHFFVIEDMAQRFLPKMSPYTELAVMSFSPTKLFTIGYGGAVVTRKQEYSKRISIFLDPDHAEYSHSEEVPFRIHAPISDFQCSMLISQIERYQQIITYRNQLVEKYDLNLGYPERLKPDVPFRYQIVLNNGSAKRVAHRLRDNGIGAWALGSQLIHNVFNIKGSFDNAEWWSERILSLPLHEKLTLDDITLISELVRRHL